MEILPTEVKKLKKEYNYQNNVVNIEIKNEKP
jgi:hypothetical protein